MAAMTVTMTLPPGVWDLVFGSIGSDLDKAASCDIEESPFEARVSSPGLADAQGLGPMFLHLAMMTFERGRGMGMGGGSEFRQGLMAHPPIVLSPSRSEERERGWATAAAAAAAAYFVHAPQPIRTYMLGRGRWEKRHVIVVVLSGHEDLGMKDSASRGLLQRDRAADRGRQHNRPGSLGSDSRCLFRWARLVGYGPCGRRTGGEDLLRESGSGGGNIGTRVIPADEGASWLTASVALDAPRHSPMFGDDVGAGTLTGTQTGTLTGPAGAVGGDVRRRHLVLCGGEREREREVGGPGRPGADTNQDFGPVLRIRKVRTVSQEASYVMARPKEEIRQSFVPNPLPRCRDRKRPKGPSHESAQLALHWPCTGFALWDGQQAKGALLASTHRLAAAALLCPSIQQLFALSLPLDSAIARYWTVLTGIAALGIQERHEAPPAPVFLLYFPTVPADVYYHYHYITIGPRAILWLLLSRAAGARCRHSYAKVPSCRRNEPAEWVHALPLRGDLKTRNALQALYRHLITMGEAYMPPRPTSSSFAPFVPLVATRIPCQTSLSVRLVGLRLLSASHSSNNAPPLFPPPNFALVPDGSPSNPRAKRAQAQDTPPRRHPIPPTHPVMHLVTPSTTWLWVYINLGAFTLSAILHDTYLARRATMSEPRASGSSVHRAALLSSATRVGPFTTAAETGRERTDAVNPLSLDGRRRKYSRHRRHATDVWTGARSGTKKRLRMGKCEWTGKSLVDACRTILNVQDNTYGPPSHSEKGTRAKCRATTILCCISTVRARRAYGGPAKTASVFITHNLQYKACGNTQTDRRASYPRDESALGWQLRVRLQATIATLCQTLGPMYGCMLAERGSMLLILYTVHYAYPLPPRALCHVCVTYLLLSPLDSRSPSIHQRERRSRFATDSPSPAPRPPAGDSGPSVYAQTACVCVPLLFLPVSPSCFSRCIPRLPLFPSFVVQRMFLRRRSGFPPFVSLSRLVLAPDHYTVTSVPSVPSCVVGGPDARQAGTEAGDDDGDDEDDATSGSDAQPRVGPTEAIVVFANGSGEPPSPKREAKSPNLHIMHAIDWLTSPIRAAQDKVVQSGHPSARRGCAPIMSPQYLLTRKDGWLLVLVRSQESSREGAMRNLRDNTYTYAPMRSVCKLRGDSSTRLNGPGGFAEVSASEQAREEKKKQK
ncbi:hypothetical protein HRG_014758 [Hirsutella rhossiliensis]